MAKPSNTHTHTHTHTTNTHTHTHARTHAHAHAHAQPLKVINTHTHTHLSAYYRSKCMPICLSNTPELGFRYIYRLSHGWFEIWFLSMND